MSRRAGRCSYSEYPKRWPSCRKNRERAISPTRAPSTTATESATGSRSKMRTTLPTGVVASSQSVLVTSSAIVRGAVATVSVTGVPARGR